MVFGSGAAAGQSQDPPDQVDPPAEGEGEPLDDPSEPESSGYTTAGYPSPSISLSGQRWRRPEVNRFSAANAVRGAARASRIGWNGHARSVVLVSASAPFAAVAASGLAGAVDGPVLLTSPSWLSTPARRELSRLSPQRVFVVGSVADRVRRGVSRTGANVIRLTGSTPPALSMAVARAAVARGAQRDTIIVVSGRAWRDSLGVPALAAGRRIPVLLANRRTGRLALARRARELGARRVFVVGRRSVISDLVVSGLPNVTRLAGATAVATVTATASRAHAVGLTRRPTLVGARSWVDAATWGVMMGSRRESPVLTSNGPGLSRSTMRWLDRVSPARVALVRAATSIDSIARCQVAKGRQRSWYCAEKTLRRQGYHMPKVDGRADRFSLWAIYAFEKVAGLGAYGSFGNREWNRMLRNPRMKVRRPDLPDTHVEINIGKQLILLVKNGKVRNHLHTSTGKASTPTIRGTFTVYEKRPYYQPHNHMYKSIFFYGGYAMHGYPSIPTYPASHGCARTYNGNQDFIYPRVFIGERVATY